MKRLMFEKLIDKKGQSNQVIVSVEEMSELQKELCKGLRTGEMKFDIEHISEEMADVYIMLYQLELIFKNKKKIRSWTKMKIKRIKERYLNEN